MKTKHFFPFLLIFAAVLASSGCQGLPAQGAAAARSVTATPFAASSTPLPRPTLAPTASVTSTPNPAAAVEEAARSFASALEKSDAAAIAGQLSEFGLSYAGLTRGEAAQQLSGGKASYSIRQTSLLNAQTALVRVRVTPAEVATPPEEETTAPDLETATQGEATWVFRLENGVWRYNTNGLIDTLTLDAAAQTTGGVTLKPRMLVRYSDHIRLELLAQNQTNDPVVLGQPNEILAQFHFSGQTVEAVASRILLEPLRSYPTVFLTVEGEFTSFPTSVDIRIWKDYQVAPWFSFDLTR